MHKAGLKGSLLWCNLISRNKKKISNINLILKATKERRRRTTTTTNKNPRVSRRGIGRNKWNRNKKITNNENKN